MVQDLKKQWDEPSMGCMPHGTKEMGDQKFSGCTIRVEPTRDVSSGDETSLHRFNQQTNLILPLSEHLQTLTDFPKTSCSVM
jgi:hypothetical protein